MSEGKRLEGRTAIVTGSAQGIGAAYALGLAAEGAHVIVCDIQDVTSTTRAIEEAGGVAMGKVLDCTDTAALQGLVAEVVAAYGRVDVLVNNAALFASLRPTDFCDITADEWDQVMRVNTRGPFECSKAVVPTMRRQQYGKIINIATGMVYKGGRRLAHYVASKGAVVALTHAMARELGAYGIGVNCIAPGITVGNAIAEMGPETVSAAAMTVTTRCFRREQTPADLVGTVVFLASAESDFITGQTVIVDGGAVFN
jgi:NAD(P)-dependent dehydrogenase (short-subunit alcohol dehydrogenase family)